MTQWASRGMTGRVPNPARRRTLRRLVAFMSISTIFGAFLTGIFASAFVHSDLFARDELHKQERTPGSIVQANPVRAYRLDRLWVVNINSVEKQSLDPAGKYEEGLNNDLQKRQVIDEEVVDERTGSER